MKIDELKPAVKNTKIIREKGRMKTQIPSFLLFFGENYGMI